MTKPRTEVVLDIGEQHAGELVGWASAERLEGDVDRTVVDVVTAIVGETGASISVEYLPQGYYKAVGIRGLSQVYAYQRLMTGDNEQHYTKTDRFTRRNTVVGVAELLLGGCRILNSEGVSSENSPRQWQIGPSGVVNGIRRALENIGAEDYYPAFYYGYNAESAYHRDRHDAGHFPVLADPEMADVTQFEIITAAKIIGILMAIQALDQRMLDSIDIRGKEDLPTLVDDFVASREGIAVYEREMLEVKKILFHPWSIYRPINYALTHPYMDPAGNEYDLERQALLRKERYPVIRQIHREIKAADSRIGAANRGIAHLNELHEAEVAAVA